MPGLKTKTLGPKSGCTGLNGAATVVAEAVPAGRTARGPSARLTAITQSRREVYLRTLMSSSPLPSFLHATLRRSPQPHVPAHWNGVEADNSDVAVHSDSALADTVCNAVRAVWSSAQNMARCQSLRTHTAGYADWWAALLFDSVSNSVHRSLPKTPLSIAPAASVRRLARKVNEELVPNVLVGPSFYDRRVLRESTPVTEHPSLIACQADSATGPSAAMPPHPNG